MKSTTEKLEGARARFRSSKELDDIAFGILAKHGLLVNDSYFDTVITSTADIARQMEIDNEDIKCWVVSKRELYTTRNSVIESALGKFS